MSPVPSYKLGMIIVLEGIEWEGLFKVLSTVLSISYTACKYFSVNVSIVGAL